MLTHYTGIFLFSFGQACYHGFPAKPSALAWDPLLRLLAIATKSGHIRMYPFHTFFFFFARSTLLCTQDSVVYNWVYNWVCLCLCTNSGIFSCVGVWVFVVVCVYEYRLVIYTEFSCRWNHLDVFYEYRQTDQCVATFEKRSWSK